MGKLIQGLGVFVPPAEVEELANTLADKEKPEHILFAPAFAWFVKLNNELNKDDEDGKKDSDDESDG